MNVCKYIAEGGWPLWLQLGALGLGLIAGVALLLIECQKKEEHRWWRLVAAVTALLTPALLMIAATIENKQDNDAAQQREVEFKAIVGSVNGGDSYCVLSVSADSTRSQLLFTPMVYGEHPLHHVKIIVDRIWEISPQLEGLDHVEAYKRQRSLNSQINIDLLYSGIVGAPIAVDWPKRFPNHGVLTFTFVAQNGNWEETFSYYFGTNGFQHRTDINLQGIKLRKPRSYPTYHASIHYNKEEHEAVARRDSLMQPTNTTRP